MKILSLISLFDIVNVSTRTIQRRCKQAKDKNQTHITIKSQTFYFRNKLEGKGYEFCEVPFSELSVPPVYSSLKDTYVSEVQKEHHFRELNIPQEIKLLRLPALQQEQIELKELFVLEYKKNISNIITKLEIPAFIERFSLVHERELEVTGLKLNKTNLRRWRNAYEESGRYGLMKSSGNTKGKSYKIDASILQELEDKFFEKRGNITAKSLYNIINSQAHHSKKITDEEYKRTLSELGGIVSLGTVKNLVKNLKETATFKYLINPDKYKNSYLPAFGDMRAKATHANHYWEIDSTQLDAFGKDGNGESTWQLISISDIKTAMKVVTVAKTSSSKAIAELLYKAFKKLGIPAHIVTDNGKDYLSNHITGLLKEFGINHIRTEPFSGEQKPFVERHFGTLQNSFTELLNGFKGHDVAGFKAIQSQVAKSARLSGNAPDREAEFINDIATKLDEWVDNVYSNSLNRTLGASPYEAFERDAEKIYRTNVKDLAYKFGKSVEINIGKKGIRLNKKLYNTKNGELGNRIGTKALLTLDFINTSIGYLYDLDGAFIGLVTDEKISIHGALESRKVFKNQTKEFEKKWKEVVAKNKNDTDLETITEACKKVFKDSIPIESIGGAAITQNSKIIDGLVDVADEINRQLDAINTINEKPNLELHEKVLKHLQAEPKKRPAMTYDELILGKQARA